ncbi:hypothetical protein ACMD2_26737 [Ananas comosus]|uniref:Uncharacterized protein n=1 Tax=Ananas comosus TaxID=4615 RepID=A0A199UJW8_ANACO|nr:hypothetical protein ACMD2_26737 [Ananas comosus]
MISADKNPSGSNGLKQAPLEPVPAQGSGAAPVQRAEEEEGLEEDEDLGANKWGLRDGSGERIHKRCRAKVTSLYCF